ncbi:ABC transporter ATP-binding protein [Psychrobacter sp. I-STPA6b]|uniref:ABC transporter ATP-binding protein n=1 Tax=Psychrobacter sp. I-STPA6b TaxID=2585718 RepID=UPI0022229D1B|nr:ABC transporter ATP-binding protein [Psychrobacter sp. I-STPA6b]
MSQSTTTKSSQPPSNNSSKDPSKPSAKSPSHWQIIEPVKSGIYVAMAFAVLGVACSLGAMLALAFLFRSSFAGSGADFGIGSADAVVQWHWFWWAVGFVVLGFLFRGLAFRRSHLSAFRLEVVLREQLSEHLARLPLGTLSMQGTSALSKVLQDDVKDLHAFVADSTPLYARAYASPLLAFALMLWIDWRLALVALAVLVVGMVGLSLVMSQSVDIQKEYNSAREQVVQAVVEFVQAMPVVRTFDGGQASFGRYEQALSHYLQILMTWWKRSGTASRLSMIVLHPLPTLVAILWAGLYWWWHGQLAFDTWLAILLLGTGMAEAIMPYMALYHLIEQAKVGIARIVEVQNLAELPICRNPQTPQDGSVVFEQVSFCYENRQKNALNEVSFRVPSGSFTALVGGSGAGKSTVARLIPRFWDVDSGAVKVGGVDVREIAPEVLMQQVAFVFQDNFLFSGSILDNIRLGLPDKSLDEVIQASKLAQADEFIQALPQGYDTLVGERGASLSGGQRQRITIARAILQDRPILVLDEATAFADAENEALLMQALHNLMQGKTVLMIAHRLASVQDADQILVFDKGNLVEAGTPQQLLAQDGAYADLWQAYQQAQHWQIGEPC